MLEVSLTLQEYSYWPLYSFQVASQISSVQCSDSTIAKNVSDPKETPEAIRAAYKYIVAVDIGMIYTKVAWSHTKTAETNVHVFSDGQWWDRGQVPTAVLYRPSQHRRPPWEFDSFGHAAIHRHREEKQDCALFQTFTMELYNRKVSTLSSCTC